MKKDFVVALMDFIVVAENEKDAHFQAVKELESKEFIPTIDYIEKP